MHWHIPHQDIFTCWCLKVNSPFQSSRIILHINFYNENYDIEQVVPTHCVDLARSSLYGIVMNMPLVSTFLSFCQFLSGSVDVSQFSEFFHVFGLSSSWLTRIGLFIHYTPSVRQVKSVGRQHRGSLPCCCLKQHNKKLHPSSNSNESQTLSPITSCSSFTSEQHSPHSSILLADLGFSAKNMTRLGDRDSAIATALAESGSLVAVTTLPGKNRGLVATQHIKAGTTVLLEKPVACASLPGHAELEQRCAMCLTSQLHTVTPGVTSADGATHCPLQEPLSHTNASSMVTRTPSSSCSSCCGLQSKNLPQCSPLAYEFLAWSHLNCPTMALAGMMALQAIAERLDVTTTLLAQYDEAPWTTIAPNPHAFFIEGEEYVEHAGEGDDEGERVNEKGLEDDDDDEEEEEEEDIDHTAMMEKEESAWRQHCQVLCHEAYELLGLEKSGITLNSWDRLIGIVEKNAGFILPNSPFRDALEANINKAVSGSNPTFEEEAFYEYAAKVGEHAQTWCSKWGDEEDDDDDEDEGGEEEEEEEEEEANSADDRDHIHSGDEEEEQGGFKNNDQKEAKEDEDEDEDEEDDLRISADHPLMQPVSELVHHFNCLPPPEYTGLFPAFAIMNHSCCPNVEVRRRADIGQWALLLLVLALLLHDLQLSVQCSVLGLAG